MAKTQQRNWISVVVILIIIGGIYIYSKQRVDDKYKQYYAYYNSANGLQPSSPVMINGVRIGKIRSIDIIDQQVKVALLVNSDINIPNDTRAMLTSGGVLSDMSVVLELGKSTTPLPENARLICALDSSVMPVSVRVTPYVETAKYLLRSVDSTMNGIDFLTRSGMFTTFISPLMSAEKTLEKTAKLSQDLNGDLTRYDNTIKELCAGTDKMAAKSREWSTTIKNIDHKTSQLVRDSLAKNINTLASLTKSLKGVTQTASDKNNAVGKLVNEKDAYNNTTKSLDEVNGSLKQTYESPTGFRLIGKDKKKKQK